jgi:hypothetical protein
MTTNAVVTATTDLRYMWYFSVVIGYTLSPDVYCEELAKTA